ncbi:MAG TPA: TetR/AcrR family transcriptional regulator [Spirochaetota bacterium]|nr:TetR/AcrR family transcriptional regulator [Spirochaetota bacterium]HRX49061.1 TetR/AcrR family transcriptional regulator [Spirochaetota bacterium]
MKKEAKQEEIFRNTLKVFAEYGYKKTTIEDIAESMGMAVGTLYLYAKNKRDLYLSSVAYGLNLWQQSVKEAVIKAEPGGPLAKLEALCFTAYHYLSGDSILQKILERDPELLPLFESKDPYLDINRESVAMLKSILAEGVEAGIFEIPDIDDAAKSLFFIYIMFVQKTYIATEGDAVKGMFNIIINLMIKGLLKK